MLPYVALRCCFYLRRSQLPSYLLPLVVLPSDLSSLSAVADPRTEPSRTRTRTTTSSTTSASGLRCGESSRVVRGTSGASRQRASEGVVSRLLAHYSSPTRLVPSLPPFLLGSLIPLAPTLLLNSALTPSKKDNGKVLSGESNFRDMFREMLGSVHHSFEECKEVLRKSECARDAQRRASAATYGRGWTLVGGPASGGHGELSR